MGYAKRWNEPSASKRRYSRILIERPAVTFGTKASRLEKGFPGIYWTDERIDSLRDFCRTTGQKCELIDYDSAVVVRLFHEFQSFRPRRSPF